MAIPTVGTSPCASAEPPGDHQRSSLAILWRSLSSRSARARSSASSFSRRAFDFCTESASSLALAADSCARLDSISARPSAFSRSALATPRSFSSALDLGLGGVLGRLLAPDHVELLRDPVLGLPRARRLAARDVRLVNRRALGPTDLNQRDRAAGDDGRQEADRPQGGPAPEALRPRGELRDGLEKGLLAPGEAIGMARAPKARLLHRFAAPEQPLRLAARVPLLRGGAQLRAERGVLVALVEPAPQRRPPAGERLVDELDGAAPRRRRGSARRAGALRPGARPARRASPGSTVRLWSSVRSTIARVALGVTSRWKSAAHRACCIAGVSAATTSIGVLASAPEMPPIAR